MARLSLFVVVTALLAASCDATSSVTLTSIMPQKLSVNTSFVIDGQRVSAPTPPCMLQAPGSACLPKPHARRDSVVVTYSVLPQFAANSSDKVQLKGCYSPYSQVNRPWRATNNLIAKAKGCPFVIASGLSPMSGNATWNIPQNTPIATYYVRAYVLAKNMTDVNSPIPVAFGNSKGYFEVVPINHREKGLKVAAGICICVGPILFTTLMLWEFGFGKKRA